MITPYTEVVLRAWAMHGQKMGPIYGQSGAILRWELQCNQRTVILDLILSQYFFNDESFRKLIHCGEKLCHK